MKEKFFLRLIGVGLLLWIVSRVDLHRCWEVLKNLNLFYFVCAMIISLPLLAVKAYRWKFILRLQDIEYPFRQVFLSFLGSIYLGLITPGRIGEYAKIFYLKHDTNVSLGKAFSSVLIDRLLDLLFILFIAGTGAVVFYPHPWLKVIYFLSLLTVLVLVVVCRHKYTRLAQFFFRIVAGKKWKGFTIQLEDFMGGMRSMQKGRFCIAVFLTVISYGLFFARCYLVALSLGIAIDFFMIVFFMSTVSLVVLVPISIAGLGTREGTLIFLFSQVTISQEVALSFSLLILLAVNLWTGMLGFAAWLVRPLTLEMLKKNVLKGEQVKI